MKKILAATAIACAASAPAFSSTVYSENFNDFASFAAGELGNGGYTDYMSFARVYWMRQAHGFTLSGDAWYASNGTHTDGAMLLNETGGGGRATTTITGLTAGNQYTLSFDIYGDGAAGHAFGLNVLINNAVQLSYSGTDMGQGYYANSSVPSVTLNFTASGSTAVLGFVQASPSGSWGSPIIDNIVVQDYAAAVPEPASAALILAGLGAMGVVRRRKQA